MKEEEDMTSLPNESDHHQFPFILQLLPHPYEEFFLICAMTYMYMELYKAVRLLTVIGDGYVCVCLRDVFQNVPCQSIQ